MYRMGLLMIGYACVACTTMSEDDPAQDLDQTQSVSDELASTGGAATNVTTPSVFEINLPHTNLCLQPIDGAVTDTLLELRECNGTLTQKWTRTVTSSGDNIVNLNTKLTTGLEKCVYNGAPLPLNNNTVTPARQEKCIDSEALWKLSMSSGFTAFQSRVQFRDTGFCLDLPGDIVRNPPERTLVQVFRCNGSPAQQWLVR
jgi:hypothetical protein